MASAVRSASASIDAPARKMTVDVHPGKAVDQRAAGDLDLLQVHWTQLARRKRRGQRVLGQRDQLGIVARYCLGAVMIETGGGWR